MFGGSRRHRPPTQPLTKETANPNAATAAASAFMRREPSVSLSSAAAAAALKARPATPTNVAQVQSKRALRRSASISSTGSRDRGGRELHRTPSTGSMTERTFRSPSPSPARSGAPSTQDVPPVPKIPNGQRPKTEPKNPSHKRATSLQIQPFQTASQKMKDGQGSWFGAAAAGDMSNMRRAAVVDNRASTDPRPSSPSSINFSYPRSMSETTSGLDHSGSTGSDHTMVYDPNSRRMVPRQELLMLEQSIRDASEKPARRQKHDGSRTGSYLSKGTVGRVKGTAVEATTPPSSAKKTKQAPADTYTVVTQQQREKPKQVPEPAPKAEPEPEPESDLESDLESEPSINQEAKPEFKSGNETEQTLVQSESESESDVEEPAKLSTSNEDRTLEAPRGAALPDHSVRKRPLVVHEAPELEEEREPQAVEQTVPQHRPIHGVEGVPAKSSLPSQADPERREPEDQGQPATIAATVEKPNGSVRPARVHSESPARSPSRTPHFAPTTDQLLVRHEPPPRSLSPRKSALKQSSPTRDASPSEDGSDASGAFSSVAIQEDSGLTRKKSVRVSFDDQNTMVVGESAEPPEPDLSQLPSPQAKKPWHSIIGRHKRDSVSLDDDEKMSPRPALPSFGSIREKKTRETEERPLVRPLERSMSPPAASSYSSATTNSRPAANLEPSSDHAIGSLLAREQSSRNEANISKYREPLPPVVTSVESSGYISNSSLSSDDESESEEPTQKQLSDTPESEIRTAANGNTSPLDSSPEAEPRPNDNVPTISISHPSPRIPDETQPESPQDFFDVPGGFPEDTKAAPGGPETSRGMDFTSSITEPSQSTKVVTTPTPITPQRSFESAGIAPPSPQMHDIQEESEESEGSSIYSDAYEDLSDMEGDGFMSLDAIVDSPVKPTFSQKVFEKAVAKSKENEVAAQGTPTNPSTQKPLQSPSDWENAKAYWRSLSAEERRQLEKEAMEETDEEVADKEAKVAETVRQPKSKSKKQKKQKLAETPLKTSAEQAPSHKSRDPARVYQIQPGSSWPEDEVEEPRVKTEAAKSAGGMKLRKSMRGDEPRTADYSPQVQTGSIRKSMRSGAAPIPSPQEGHFRKSLRPEPEAAAAAGTGMRKSLRANGAPSSRQKSTPLMGKGSRPASYQPPATTEPIQTHRRNHSEEREASSRVPMKPSLRRRGSDSSESSFRRARVGGGEGFGFRKTMRGSLREPAAPLSDGGKGSSSRFSLRSLSPTGSTFRRNSNTSSPPLVMGGRMRQSLRGDSSDASSSRMRVSGFGRASKAKKARGGSRFGDSSDEEDVGPAFRSRFVDSSDDEGTPTPRPKQKRVPKTMRNKASSNAAAAAMGVPPSRAEDEDSPDLPDSDEEPEQSQQPVAPNGTFTSSPRTNSTLKRSGSGRGSLGALPPSQTDGDQATVPQSHRKRRGSFMSSILRRKKDPSDKISRNLGESASRRDTHLQRSTEELAIIRSNSGIHPNGSRLQKRGANWPLQDEHHAPEEDQFEDGSQNTYVVDEEKRPSTAGGAGASPASPPTKAGFLKRRSTSHSAIGLAHPAPPSSVDGQGYTLPEGSETGTPRKKFGTLRKMFRLDD